MAFLDTPIRASAYRRIEAAKLEIGGLLAGIPTNLPLWELQAGQTYERSTELWVLLRDISSLGPTRVSKLMARKRPHLFPILDSVVREFLGNPRWIWLPLGRTLADPALRVGIESLAQDVAEKPSVLRVLDVAIWMSRRRVPEPEPEESGEPIANV